MALVPYVDPSKPQDEKVKQQYESIELRGIRQKLESLTTGMRPIPYIGLSNQGATCYMNSLLQTLFMTPEVRGHIYSYVYNSAMHGSKDYCIPYQLQKLFASLQLSRNSFAVTTSLTKSFHWTSHQSFEQQDVQEFCRVLFDAINKSFKLKLKEDDAVVTNDSSMSDLYEGISQSYVKCLTCGNESVQHDRFQDLSLPIRNEFGTGVLNSSVEMALENYIKPEILEGPNAYFCEVCDKKVNAEKGIKLVKGPKILTIVLNRFTLDYSTFQRVKLQDRVSFSSVINFNDYLNGYDGIKNKKYEQEVERMQKYKGESIKKNIEIEQTKTDKLAKMQQKKTDDLSTQPETTTTQPESNPSTESPKKETPSEQINTEPKPEPKRTKVYETQVKITVGEGETEAKPAAAMVGEFDEEQYNKYLFDASGPKRRNILDTPVDETDAVVQDLASFYDDGAYSVKGSGDKFAVGVHSSKKEKTQEEIEQEELERALEQIRKLEEEEMFTGTSKSEPQTVAELLKQGEYVYELYSIMIHNGGAYGGHYFAYIKSFEDGKWYNFNDSQVSVISDLDQLFKTFGGDQARDTAYMLMYRKVTGKEETYKFSDEQVPEYLRTEIDQDTEKMIAEQLAFEEKLLALKLKVYHNGELKNLQVKKTMTLAELIVTVLKEFGLERKTAECRLRAYDALMKVRLDVYDSYDSTLIKIKNMWTTLDLELADDQGTFEPYDSQWLFLKALAWKSNTNYDFTKPDSCPSQVIKVHRRETKVTDLEQVIAEKLGMPVHKVIIMLRHERGLANTVTCEYFNMDWRKPKLISDFSTLQHGVTLYVEENDPAVGYDKFHWKQEFDAEIEKITVNLSTAEDPEDNEFPIRIRMDRNDTVKQLKIAISDRIGLPISEFYLVRKSNSQEIKDVNKSLASLGFTNGVNIKIIKGHAKNEGVYEVKISVVKIVDDAEKDNLIFATEPIGKLEVSGELTGYLLKEAACALYNSQQGQAELTAANFRLRNPQNDLGSVVHDNDILEDLNMFDDKDFYIQLDQPDKLLAYQGTDGSESRRLTILVREWDPETWLFGPITEVEVPRTMKAVSFGTYLQKHLFPHIPDTHFFGTRIAFFKSFIRSDLAMRAWFNLIQTSNVEIAKSKLELTRDAILVIVRDNSKSVREELTPAEQQKYANQSFLDHVARKKLDVSVSHKTQDELFKEAQARKPDWSKGSKAEKAVTITVGITEDKATAATESQKVEEEEVVGDFEPFF